MNTPTCLRARFLRPLLAACLFLAALLPLRAENVQTFDIAAPAGRFSHEFTLELGGQPHGSVSGAISTDSLGPAGGTVLPYKRLTLTLDRDQPGLTLRDSSTGDIADLVWAPVNEIGLRIPGEDDFRAPPGTPPSRSFFLLENHSGNQLRLYQPGGVWYPVSIVSSVSYYSPTALQDVPAYEGRALLDPTLPYRIVDLNTGEQAPLFGTDLTQVAWEPGTGDVPIAAVTVYLEGREDGHRFTVHSRASWGPVITQSVQAVAGNSAVWPAASGGWTYDAGWNWFEVPAGSATLSFAVGRGMEFWITRMGDGLSVGGNGQMVVPPGSVASIAPQWGLYGVFPALPPPPATRTFRIHGQRYGRQFTVWLADGRHTTIPATSSTGWQEFANFDDGGNIWNPLSVFTFDAPVHPTQVWWLRDDTMGEDFPIGQSDVFDGWQPLHAEPPLNPEFTFHLFAGRGDHTFSVNGAALSELYRGDLYPYVDPSTGEEFPALSFSLTAINPTPYASGPFYLHDNTTGEFTPIWSGANDLRSWFPTPSPRCMMISSTRWGHELVVHHLNGDEYPVENYGTQGFIATTSDGSAWPVSYFYFLAGSLMRDFLPWYVIDRQTGESAGLNQDNLIDWVVLPKPGRLRASANPLSETELTWLLEDAPPDGAFLVERRQEGFPVWVPLAQLVTVPPYAQPNFPCSFNDGVPLHTFDYRIRYKFGGRYSAPSNIVSASPDSDDDGMPDWWEVLYGFDKNENSDGATDYDHDDVSNFYEYVARTDPRDYYNGETPVITLVSGDAQTSLPGEPVGYPLVVRVTKRGVVVGLENAPVKFAVAQPGFAVVAGGGKIAVPPFDAPADTLTVRTNDAGEAQVFFRQPLRARVRSRITATAGKRPAKVEFHAITTARPDGGGGNPGDGSDGDPADDPDGDWDHDGLTNAEEMEIGSDPQNEQSDDDGVADGADAMPADADISFPRAGAPHYALIDIGPGTISAINGKGEVVGTVPPAEGTEDDPTAFFWSKGMRKPLQGRKPSPRSINDSGAIVGSAEFEVPGVSDTYNVRAAHWVNADSEPTDLGSLGKITTTGNSEQDKQKKTGEWGTSIAVAINNNGMIVGESTHHFPGTPSQGGYDMGDCRRAVRFNIGGKPTALGPGKADDPKISNYVIALSEGGVAVGMTADTHSGGGYTGAALWDSGTFSDELGEDFTPTGITTAPPEDTQYAYYVVGTEPDSSAPTSVASFGGGDANAPPANLDPAARKKTAKLKKTAGGEIVTKSDLWAASTNPTPGEPIGFTARGLGFSRDTELWSNGKPKAFADSIAKPAGTTLSSIGAMTPKGLLGVGTFVASLAHGGIVYPIEILNASKAPISKLKVGKMSYFGALSGTGASATLDIDKDPDRFFIRVTGGAALGGVSVKVSTTDNPDPAYNDNATQIDLQADGGDAISKSMLLVSDDVDDGIADDEIDDRTHKVQLRGNFKIEQIKIGSGAWQAMDSKTPVPAVKKLKCDVFVLKVGGAPVRTNTQVEKEMKVVQERLAQVGVNFEYTIIEKDQPAGVDLSSGLTVSGPDPADWKKIDTETRSLISGLSTVGPVKDVHIFYVNQVNAWGINPRGAALADYCFDESEEDYINNVIVGSPHAFDPFNVAHELGHLLTDDIHHPNDTNLMMGNGTPTTNTLGASKRLDSSQETRIINSDLLSNP